MPFFDQDNQRWVRFRQSEGTVQPEAWVTADEQDGDWQSITLPTHGLLLWDETEKASAVYFIEAGQLHRVSYCEDGQYTHVLNPMLKVQKMQERLDRLRTKPDDTSKEELELKEATLARLQREAKSDSSATKKADAENKVQERGGQCHEIQGVLVAFLPAVESFSNGEWGLAANIALAQRVAHTVPQIRARVNADKLPARPDRDNWLIQRQAPPHSSSTVFKETLDASLKDYAWRIEQLVYKWLLNLKRDSTSRNDYLTALQALILGKQTSSDDGLNAHWPSIIRIRQFIAGLNSEYFHEEWRGADVTPLKEYALHCMAAEYQQVAGVEKLPFDYSKDNIPEPEATVTVSDSVMQEALQLYNAYINDTLTLKQISEFYRHLNTPRTNRPIKSPYAYLVRWLRLHDDAGEARVKHKLRLDALKTITRFGAPTPEQCNEIANCRQRETLNETLRPWYDTLEALLDERQILALLEPEHAERLKELNGWQIMWIAGQYEAFALALLKPENAEALKKLGPQEIPWIAEQCEAFALALLKPENAEALKKLGPQEIPWIAEQYEAFALALLEPQHAEVLKNLNLSQIYRIAKRYKAFALALLKPRHAETLKKLHPSQVSEIAIQHETFALGLLKPEHTVTLKQFNGQQLVCILLSNEAFALALLEPQHAETLKKLHPSQVSEIAKRYEAFALALPEPENTEALKKLDPQEITLLAEQYEAFALALLEPRNTTTLASLNSTIILALAKRYENFVLALLKPENVEALKKLSGLQIMWIARVHEAFALALLEPQHAETLKNLDSFRITDLALEYEAFALALLKPENAEALKKLGPQEIALLAEQYEAFALALLEPRNTTTLASLNSTIILALAKRYENFALALLEPQHAERLKELSDWQIADVAELHEAFALGLLRPENAKALKKLNCQQLRRIGEAHEAFSRGLLNLESAAALAQLNSDVIAALTRKQKAFAIELLLNHRDQLIAAGGLNLVKIIQNTLEADSKWEEHVMPVRQTINRLNSWRNPWGGAEKAALIEAALYRAMKHYDTQTDPFTTDDFLNYQEGEESSIRTAMNTPRHPTFDCFRQTLFGQQQKQVTVANLPPPPKTH